MSDPRRDAAASYPGVPAQWPSAWASVAKQVLLGCILPVVAAIIVLVILVLTDAASTAWWVALIPLLLLAWPLSLPARVRGAMQQAADSGQLDVTVAQVGILARARRKRRGVHPSAEIVGERVHYYSHGGVRPT